MDGVEYTPARFNLMGLSPREYELIQAGLQRIRQDFLREDLREDFAIAANDDLKKQNQEFEDTLTGLIQQLNNSK